MTEEEEIRIQEEKIMDIYRKGLENYDAFTKGPIEKANLTITKEQLKIDTLPLTGPVYSPVSGKVKKIFLLRSQYAKADQPFL